MIVAAVGVDGASNALNSDRNQQLQLLKQIHRGSIAKAKGGPVELRLSGISRHSRRTSFRPGNRRSE
jgi:hypothetical protein